MTTVEPWGSMRCIPDGVISKDELREAYNSDCAFRREPPMTAKAMTDAMKRLRPNVRASQKTIKDKKGVRVWNGIQLRP